MGAIPHTTSGLLDDLTFHRGSPCAQKARIWHSVVVRNESFAEPELAVLFSALNAGEIAT